jgi:hypothetical protein
VTVSSLIAELRKLPPDAEVVAGEWVSPTQLGEPKLEMTADGNENAIRLHIYSPEFYQQTEEEQAVRAYRKDWAAGL